MAIDLNQAPYFDDYDPSKNYTKIVGMPGRVSQVREFTQSQDIQEDFLKRLGNSVLKDGSVIEGCSLTVSTDDGKTVTITEGSVFVEGLVRNVPSQTLEIKGEGTEYIGIFLDRQIITEQQDPSLYDNANGYRNYGNSGAHRLQETPRWVVDTDGMTPVYQIINGQVVPVQEEDDTLAQVNDILARRTYDESGSYKVNGLKIIDRKLNDADKVYVLVQEGKAYVSGYESVKAAASLIGLDKATDTREQYNESRNFVSELTYPITNSPVEKIDEVNCLVEKTKDMTRGEIGGGFDPIDDDREGSITEIVKVWASDTEYHAVQDYVFQNDGISWEPTGGTEPGQGTSYQVTYRFLQKLDPDEYKLSHNKHYHSNVTYTLTRGDGNEDSIPVPADVKIVNISKVYKDDQNYSNGTDWTLTGAVNSYKIDWTANQSKPEGEYKVDVTLLLKEIDGSKDYLEFTSQMEDKIVNGSQITYDYTYYLARIDLLVMNPNSVVDIVKGTPDQLRKVFPPLNGNDRILPLGTVLIYPNSTQIYVTNFNNYRLDQSQLYNIRQRVDNLEYNVAMSDLDKEAMEGETPTLLKGVFTDGFIGPTKADITNKDFDCSFDFDDGFLMLPQNEGIVGMVPDQRGNASVQGGIASSPYENELLVSQEYATDTFLVNPYAIYNNLAIIEVTPYVDNWVDSSKLTVDAGTSYEKKYEDVNGGTRYVNGGTTRRTVTRGGIFADYDEVSTNSRTSSSTSTSTRTEETFRTQSDIILDEAIEYMRPIELQVRGSNFTVNTDNLTCFFNGTKVDLEPDGQTEKGSVDGTVKSDREGKFLAKFTIPEGIPCGTVEVIVSNEYNNGGTRFSAQGRRQIIQDSVFRTVTTVETRTHYKTVTRYTTITTIHDPLAQSFFIDEDCVLTQIGLFFNVKDNTKNIILEVRTLENGAPTAEILHQQVVESKDIKVDPKGQQETKITLNQPLYLEGNKSYCFVIVSDSNEYQMWTAKRGGIDEYTLSDRYQVVSNPYPEGVMFSSSNAQSWTIHQDHDLKFRLYRARFSGLGTIFYPNASLEDAGALVLAAQSADYINQGINWYYSIPSEDGKQTWLPIETFNYYELEESIDSVSLKCELITDNDRMSPFLNVESVNLIYYNNDNEGAYISRQVVMEQEFNTIQVSCEAYTPEGTSFKVFYSRTDDGSAWNELLTPQTQQLDEYFTRYTFVKDGLPAGTRKMRLKIELKSDDKLHTPIIRRLISIMKNV